MPFVVEVKAVCDLCDTKYLSDITTHSSLILGDYMKKDGWEIVKQKVICKNCTREEKQD